MLEGTFDKTAARETLISKLNVIEEFYESAAQPFRQQLAALRKYEEAEVDSVNYTSPYDELQKNEDFLNLLGQSCLCLMSTAVDNYLSDFALEKRKPLDLTRYEKVKSRAQKIICFYKDEFNINLENLRDGGDLPFSLSLIKEIIDVRNEIQHENRFWDLTCWHSKGFKFSGSVFSGEPIYEIPIERTQTQDPPEAVSSWLSVTAEAIEEATVRVKAFARCVESVMPM